MRFSKETIECHWAVFKWKHRLWYRYNYAKQYLKYLCSDYPDFYTYLLHRPLGPVAKHQLRNHKSNYQLYRNSRDT